MIFFALYAVLVWSATIHWRRRWTGLLALVLAIFILFALAALHIQLNHWTHGAIYLPVLQSILYPYIVLVGFIGLYTLVLPRTYHTRGTFRCTRCGYDLRGLRDETSTCPECGFDGAPPPPPVLYPRGPSKNIFANWIDARAARDAQRLAAQHTVPHARQQHQRGQAGDQAQPQPPQAAAPDRADQRDALGVRALRDQVILEGQPEHR